MLPSGNLIAPVTSIDFLPEGFGVSVSYTLIPTEKPHIFDVPGSEQKGLSAQSLVQIANSMDLRWVAGCSGRLDDGRTQDYVRFLSVGFTEGLDGTPRPTYGSVELDLREGSSQVRAMRARADASARRRNTQSHVEEQLRDMRLFLHRHAETKACSRAIARAGVRRSYTLKELAKPFAIARLVFTGQTDDPVLRREFAMLRAQNRLRGLNTLYGTQDTEKVAMKALQPEAVKLIEAKGEAAPAVSRTQVDSDDFFDGLDETAATASWGYGR